jgi:hypothetical protein
MAYFASDTIFFDEVALGSDGFGSGRTDAVESIPSGSHERKMIIDQARQGVQRLCQRSKWWVTGTAPDGSEKHNLLRVPERT